MPDNCPILEAHGVKLNLEIPIVLWRALKKEVEDAVD